MTDFKSRFPKLLLVLVLVGCSSILSGTKLRQIAILDLPGLPGFDSMVFAGGQLVIAHRGANTVDIFDPERRRLTAQVKGIEEPRGLAVDEQAHRVYMAAAGSKSIVVLNSQRWQVEGSIGLQQQPEKLLVIPESRLLFVTTPTERSVALVSPDSLGQPNAELMKIELPGRPQQMAWDPQRKLLYVTLDDKSKIAVVDPGNESKPVQRVMGLNASQPTGIVFDSEARRLYVAVRNAVLQLDPDTGAEISRVAAPTGVDTLWHEPSLNLLYGAAVNGQIVTIRINGDGMEAESEFHAAVRGRALAFDPATKTMFLTGGREGKSKLLLLKQSDRGIRAEGPQVAEKR